MWFVVDADKVCPPVCSLGLPSLVRLVCSLAGCPGADSDADHADGQQAGKGQAQAARSGAVAPEGAAGRRGCRCCCRRLCFEFCWCCCAVSIVCAPCKVANGECNRRLEARETEAMAKCNGTPRLSYRCLQVLCVRVFTEVTPMFLNAFVPKKGAPARLVM